MTEQLQTDHPVIGGGLRFTGLLSVVAVLSAGIVSAQSSAPQPISRLTLAQAIQRAEANYPRILRAAEQRAAAEAGVAAARTAYLPRTDLLWQTNRATANNIYDLLLPQGVITSLTGPVIPADNSRSAWSSAGGALFSWQPFDFGLRRCPETRRNQGPVTSRKHGDRRPVVIGPVVGREA